MNPIDELRAARPGHLGDRPVDERTRAVELARAMSRPREAGRRPGRRKIVRPAWGLGLAGAVAAATAVVMVVSGNGAGNGNGIGTGNGNGTLATTSRAPSGQGVVATAGPSASAAPRVRLSAREVLLAAAEKADQRTEGSGDYWHSVSVGRNLYTAKDGGYLVMDQDRSEGWTPSATGGEQWSRSASLGAKPATEEDRTAWEQAGAPSEIEALVPGKGGGKGKYGAITLSTSPGRATTSHSPLVDGDKVFWLGRNVTMKDLRALPGEPGELKKWLMASYEGHGTESTSEKMSGDAWLFRVSVGLIMDMPVTPEVRGAAFRMLADLDDVKVTGDVTDAEGRQGTAVSVEESGTQGSVYENRLVFDEETGQALANEQVVVKPGGLQADFEPGTVWNSNALIEAGWTDDKPAS
ncbi:CU044_5270 family protein [Nonomuraea insulae]|uniref:CU044_5270 family protein n=1 Tax=Nonomuraea insulae TaxID=1616787 RepID=A0ABW1D2Z0_9ACTN